MCVRTQTHPSNTAGSRKKDSGTPRDLGFRNGENARFHQIGATNKMGIKHD